MIKDITAGQFFPGDSLLHRTDARFKIIILVVFLVTVLVGRKTGLKSIFQTGLAIFFKGRITGKSTLRAAAAPLWSAPGCRSAPGYHNCKYLCDTAAGHHPPPRP